MMERELERYDIDGAMRLADAVVTNNTDQPYALEDELALILGRHGFIELKEGVRREAAAR